MKDQEQSRLGQVLINLSLVFPKEVSEQVIELYWHALKGYELDRISAACEYLVANRRTSFFPNPADIKEAIRSLPTPQHQQIPETTTITLEEQEKVKNRLAFYRFESKRHVRGIHPDDVETWNRLMEEFRIEYSITDERAARLIDDRRRSGRIYLRGDPNFFGDENLYVQFGKWATRKNRTYSFGQPEQSYLSIIQDYMRDEKIRDVESMKVLARLLSTKRQGALTR